MSPAEFSAKLDHMCAPRPTDRVAIGPQRRVVKVSGRATGDGNGPERLQSNVDWISVYCGKERQSVPACLGIVERAVGSSLRQAVAQAGLVKKCGRQSRRESHGQGLWLSRYCAPESIRHDLVARIPRGRFVRIAPGHLV
jgi:hypothetical protein